MHQTPPPMCVVVWLQFFHDTFRLSHNRSVLFLPLNVRVYIVVVCGRGSLCYHSCPLNNRTIERKQAFSFYTSHSTFCYGRDSQNQNRIYHRQPMSLVVRNTSHNTSLGWVVEKAKILVVLFCSVLVCLNSYDFIYCS